MQGKRRLMFSGKKEKRNYQEHETQVFLIYLSFRVAFLFCFWENLLFTSYVACYCYVSSCRKAFKYLCTDLLQNSFSQILQYSQQNTCVVVFLTNFIKRDSAQVFSSEYLKMFKYSYFYSTHPVNYTFPMFYAMIDFFGFFFEFFGYKTHIFHIPCAIALFSFITLALESEVHCYFAYILFLYQNLYIFIFIATSLGNL